MSSKKRKLKQQKIKSPNLLKGKMGEFNRWKSSVTEVIQLYQSWLTTHNIQSAALDLRTYDILESLKSEKLTVAIVAELSRGKTELINALFFADLGCRLLPSEAGRTTMCPTEIFYDHEEQSAYLKLLPIETRKSDSSLLDIKQSPEQWTKHTLDAQSPEQMSSTLKELTLQKQVTVKEAKQLGLFNSAMESDQNLTDDDKVDIPKWRHAQISFPHPLLKQGLAILDTPGMNALGVEPELTLSMIPSAQAILFVLGVETGVTHSDMNIWETLENSKNNRSASCIAALNKIDTLWDDLQSDTYTQTSINNQQSMVAETLKISHEQVFPLSAKVGLTAKVKNNPDLLKKSRLLELENFIATTLLENKQKLAWDNTTQTVSALFDDSKKSIQKEINETKRQQQDLNLLKGDSVDNFQQLMNDVRKNQFSFKKHVQDFTQSQKKLSKQSSTLKASLEVAAIDKLIARTRKDMSNSWTTGGLKSGMKIFFDSIRDLIQISSRHVEAHHQAGEHIFDKFKTNYALEEACPEKFAFKNYATQLEVLYLEAEMFRTSTKTTLTEQSFVIKSFFISLVSHVRELFITLNRDMDTWLKSFVTPLANQIKHTRKMLDQHMQTLCRINESRNSLDEEIEALEKSAQKLEIQLKQLEELHKKLLSTLPTEQSSKKAHLEMVS